MSTERDWQKEALEAREHVRKLRGELLMNAHHVGTGRMAVLPFNETSQATWRERAQVADVLRTVVAWSIREMPDLADRP